MKQLIEELEKMVGAKFVSITYTAKSSGETARYTFQMGVDYSEVCQRDITELEIRLRDAKDIEAIVIKDQIASLQESIKAREEGREHVGYTKKNLYRQICPGVKVNLNDGTFEIGGFQHTRKVLTPGVHKRTNHKTEETALKAKIRDSLKVGQFRTLSIDPGVIHCVKLNGEEISFE
jgi:hypothetical protein